MKRVLTDLKLPKLELISSAVAIECHRCERLAVLKMFARLFCFEQVKALTNVWEKLSTSKTKKKNEAETKRCVYDLEMSKLAQIFEQSSVVRQACRFFFSVHCIKQIDSILPCICSVIDLRRRQNISNALAVVVRCNYGHCECGKCVVTTGHFHNDRI